MISVIMPVYNAVKFLNETIESILNQTEKNFEFIVINDGSTDDSEEIIRSYSDSRIKYFHQQNGGESSARNAGLEQAKGEFVVWQDADDVSQPIRLEVLKRQFTSSSIGFVHSDMLIINETGSAIGYWQSQHLRRSRILRFFLKVGTPYNNASMMIRREVLSDLQYDTAFKVGPDSDIVRQFATKWDSVHISEPLVSYRIHSNNSFRNTDYDTLHAYVKKFLNCYTIEELIPELDWNCTHQDANTAKACAIIALFLTRRGVYKEASEWYEKATALIQNPEIEKFVAALGHLALKNYNESIYLLQSLIHKDHVAENYLGEAYAYAGDMHTAQRQFIQAIKLCPSYDEPMENLKALGGKYFFEVTGGTWRKYHKM